MAVITVPAPIPSMAGTRSRVLFVAHDSSLFGAQRVLLTLLAGLDRAAYECHVVAPEDGPFVAAVRGLGHQVHLRHMVRWVPAVAAVERAGRVRYLRQFLSGLRARAWAVAALIERYGIEVVYTNTVTCCEGALAARMASVPHVWYLTEPIFDNPELRGILPRFVYHAALSALATELVFCSRSLAADYGALQRRSQVVYPSVPLPLPRDRAAARAALLAQLGVAPDKRIVGVVGALQPRKDHATFLEAAKAISVRRHDVVFLIAGSGSREFTDEVAGRIGALSLAGNTRLLGWWPGEIAGLMAGLDVLVISSIQESFGLTAIEALAVETAVVSTRCGGPAEVIRDGIDGSLVPVGDASAMALAIEALLDDPARSLALARSGRERVLANFSAERFVQGVEAVLQAAGKRRAARAQGAPA